jgi:hypothetical protein
MRSKYLVLILSFSTLINVRCSDNLDGEIEDKKKEIKIGYENVMPMILKIPEIKKNLINYSPMLPDTLKSKAQDISFDLQKSANKMNIWKTKLETVLKHSDDKKKKLENFKNLALELKQIDSLTYTNIMRVKEIAIYLKID